MASSQSEVGDGFSSFKVSWDRSSCGGVLPLLTHAHDLEGSPGGVVDGDVNQVLRSIQGKWHIWLLGLHPLFGFGVCSFVAIYTHMTKYPL